MSVRTLYIFVVFTTAATPTRRNQDTIQTERGTCALPFIVAGVASRNEYVDE